MALPDVYPNFKFLSATPALTAYMQAGTYRLFIKKYRHFIPAVRTWYLSSFPAFSRCHRFIGSLPSISALTKSSSSWLLFSVIL